MSESREGGASVFGGQEREVEFIGTRRGQFLNIECNKKILKKIEFSQETLKQTWKYYKYWIVENTKIENLDHWES